MNNKLNEDAENIYEQVHNGASISDVIQLLTNFQSSQPQSQVSEALKKINQMSDCGSPEATIIRMKEIASEALKKIKK